MSHSEGLEGLRVVELCDETAAFAGRVLVGLGAEVVRVTLVPGPGLAEPVWGGTELDRTHLNAGKVEVTIDPADHPEQWQKLLAGADVLITSLDSARLAAAGVPSLQELRRSAPGLVVVSVLPFGSTGPRREWKGTDLTACATGGMMSLIGDPDGAPLRPPRHQADHLSGVSAVIGALLALAARRRTGRGQMVEISAQEVVASTLEFAAIAYLYQRRLIRRNGSRYHHVPHLVVATRDGFAAGGFGGTPRLWQGLLDWLVEMGAAEDLVEEKWADEGTRWEEREHVYEVLDRAFSGVETAYLAEEATRRGLPWSAVYSASDLLRDPQLQSRQFFSTVADPGTGQAVGDSGFGFCGIGRPRPLDLRSSSSAGTPSAVDAGAKTASGTDRAALADMGGSLAGLRVLDLTWVLAGPFATRILADHGAEVIKIESRRRHDPTRYSESMHFSPVEGGGPDASGYFANHNRNKRSITLNLKESAAKDVARRLALQCDVIFENFSAGVLERLGLDPEALRAENPRLIVVRMSGVGQHGPAASASAFADTLAAWSGMTAETAPEDGRPRGMPFGLGDMIAGYHAAASALAALERRHETGQGAVVDLSQLECAISHTGAAFLEAARGIPKPGSPNDHRRFTPHGVFRCAGEDAWCTVAVRSDEERLALARLIGSEDDGHMEAQLTEWFSQRAPDEAMESLQAAGVPAGAVQDARMLTSDPHLAERGFYQTIDHPVLGPLVHEGMAIRLSETPGRIAKPAPLLGEDTDSVLGELLGLSEKEIAKMAEEGILE